MNPFLHEFQELFEPRLLKAGPGLAPLSGPDTAGPVEAAAEPQGSDLPRAELVRLWDLPTRLFHWSLVAAVTVAIATGLVGGNWMELHGQAGLSIAGLLAFRVVWGLIGNRQARFRHFMPGPRQLQAYLQGRWLGLGHNPLGALSVLALLGLLAAQVSTGLFGNDEIAFTGPLESLVDEALSLRLTGWHQSLSTVLFVLLGLHVAAIAAHRGFKKDDLLTPMISGLKPVQAPSLIELARADEQARDRSAWALPLSLFLALGSAAATVWLASGAALPTSSAQALGATPSTVTSTATAAPAAAASAASPTPGW